MRQKIMINIAIKLLKIIVDREVKRRKRVPQVRSEKEEYLAILTVKLMRPCCQCKTAL